MLRLVKAFLAVILCFASHVTLAATLIELQTGPGNYTQVMMDGDHARVGMGKRQGYVLIDHGRRTMFVVDHEQKQILNMLFNLLRIILFQDLAKERP